mmetsp:Transcript_18011/g.45019  ORF Transcript_18011/g.45019 Transcript_18011/m.45019 type:complete len:260 (+) Transcript_18011:1155-1934(+)
MAKRFSGSELSFWGAGGGEFSSESFTDAELSSLVEEVVVFSESGDEASVEGGGEPSAVGSLFEAPKTPRGSLGGLQPKSPIVSTKVLGGIKIIQKLSPELHSRKYMGTRTKPDLETRAKKLGVTGQDMAVLDKITDKRPLAAERASRDGKLNYTPDQRKQITSFPIRLLPRVRADQRAGVGRKNHPKRKETTTRSLPQPRRQGEKAGLLPQWRGKGETEGKAPDESRRDQAEAKGTAPHRRRQGNIREEVACKKGEEGR